MNKHKYPTCRTCVWLTDDKVFQPATHRQCMNMRSLAVYIGPMKWQFWYAFGCIHHKEHK